MITRDMQEEGVLPGQDGNRFSYSYIMWDSRVVMVSYFSHHGDTRIHTVTFQEQKH